MNVQANLSSKTPKPAHIPESLVYHFDLHHDPALQADPQARIGDLMENAPPVFWTPCNGGHWVALSHEANFAASRNTDTFSSEIIPYKKIRKMMVLQRMLGHLGIGGGRVPLPFPILVDPPFHTRYRQPLQAVFSPKNVQALETSVRQLAGELIDSIIDRGHCEFMSDIAEPLPVKVFLKMLGLPVEKLADYRRLLKEHMASHEEDINPRKKMSTLRGVADAMDDTLLERRENPRDDIISYLWNTEIDGKPMSLDIMENYGVLLFIAGLDTVMQSMGYAVRHLATDKTLQEQLRADPAQIEEAVEEFLRRYAFVAPMRRIAGDLIFLGVEMKANEKILLFLPGANVDPARFPDPEKVDLQRENKAHIAFNGGPHRCLGSHLARMELRVLCEEFLSRVPPFRLHPDHPPQFETGHIVGVKTLNLVWNP